MPEFKIISKLTPQGDQPAAIEQLTGNLNRGQKCNVLLGVTGSGKTFTMANVIEQMRKPTLVISHNKTLAAQLYEEFKELFPENAVEYFVSYYDYYQPEAYIPQRDIYIEKDAARSDDLDRLRLSATTSLTHRRDVIVVASVSSIFGLGNPEAYKSSILRIRIGDTIERNELLARLVHLQYDRNDMDFKRGTFRVRGDTVDLYPPYEEFGYQIEFFGDQIDALRLINPTTGDSLSETDQVFVFPTVHYVVDEDAVERAVVTIRQEMEMQVIKLKNEGKLLEAQRLSARTRYDMEMMTEVGYCPGIENYSRHLDGRQVGQRPFTLIDYFDDDFLLIIDESHVMLPQIRAMFNGDQARKRVLVDHGFRLPSAMDNRPLTFDEFQAMWGQVVFVSATPNDYELTLAGGEIVEQVIRPTGLVDPEVQVRPAGGQVKDILSEIATRAENNQRVLVTTVTKRLAEDLSDYIRGEGFRCQYLHSEVDTLDRIDILRELREGTHDVIVGVNLLREGLDLPEVSLVCILDADKQGFLRSATSLIQTIGRCARNVNAKVILYGDTVTAAMQKAMDETARRRKLQLEFNRQHGITPKTIEKEIRSVLADQLRASQTARKALCEDQQKYDRTELLAQLEREMLAAAEALEFEKATRLRDRIAELKEQPQTAGEQIENQNSKSGKSISDANDEELPDTKENWESYKEPTKTTRGTKRQKRL